MKAAKEKMFLLVFVVLTMFTCAPSFASATALEISKPRAELKSNRAENRVEQSLFYSVKHGVNYDLLREVALESSVAPKTGGFNLPGGGKFRPDPKVLDEAIEAATSSKFIERAKRLGFSDEAIAALPDRLRQYGDNIGTQLFGGWADGQRFIVGRLGPKAFKDGRIFHELGHVLDDLVNPGLFGRAKYTFKEFFDAETVAYFMQSGRFRPMAAGLNATYQRFPTATTVGVVIGSPALGYGFVLGLDWLFGDGE